MGDVLRVSLIQTDIVWEDKRANLDKCAAILSHITGDCDLVVFPEMFTTGFSMRAEDLAECIDGETITEVKKWSRNYNVAIAGSFIARAGNVCFNRGFFIEPDGSEHYYDKRHLFRMGEEGRHFVSGAEKRQSRRRPPAIRKAAPASDNVFVSWASRKLFRQI